MDDLPLHIVFPYPYRSSCHDDVFLLREPGNPSLYQAWNQFYKNHPKNNYDKKQIDKAREDIDERLLYSYERIRNNYRNGLAVVAVERDACGGCYNAIPPQKQSEIRQRKKIIVCENCGRILTDEELSETVEIK